MSEFDEAVDDLKYFVAVFFDGSIERCFDLDELIWEVRLTVDSSLSARKHLPNHVPNEMCKPVLKDVNDLLADIGL